MIIVPTEKQFDWAHAPLVLICIVLLNILTYFLYQSSDNLIAFEALSAYQEEGYAEKEWPLFTEYLREEGEDQTLKDYEEQAKVSDVDELAVLILLRRDFYDFLQDQPLPSFTEEERENWRIQRPLIQQDFNSISSIAWGLSAKYFKPLALLTHQFLHGGIMHLLGNMFFLVICGFAVEAAIGHWRFLVFYLICGVAAGLAQVASDLDSSTPLVGASGAISGVMAMYLAVFRLRKIEFFYWVFFLVGYIRAPALLILPFYIGKELLDYYTNPDSNVAFMAHAGGFVCGAVLIGMALLFKLKIVNTEYVETDTSIDPQQEKMAAIYQAIEQMRFDSASTLVSQMIEEHGSNFTLEKIRYNLLKLNKGEDYKACVTQLLSLKRLLPHEIDELEKIWRKNTSIQTEVDDDTLLKLGLQFSTLSSTDSAEAITDALVSRRCKNPDLLLLARKMSGIFAQLDNPSKRDKFATITQQLKKEQHHGVL